MDRLGDFVCVTIFLLFLAIADLLKHYDNHVCLLIFDKYFYIRVQNIVGTYADWNKADSRVNQIIRQSNKYVMIYNSKRSR